MFDKLTLRFTELPQPLSFPGQGVTVFVGPNNSGKSLVLREVESFVGQGNGNNLSIVKDLDFVWQDDAAVQADIARLEAKKPPGTDPNNVYFGRFGPNGNFEESAVNRNSLIQEIKARNKEWVASAFLRFFLVRLDGRTRFNLTNDRERGDALGRPPNLFAQIFVDDLLRKEVRDVVHEAFGTYFVLDPTNGSQLRIRLSKTEPQSELEQSLSQAARDFHKAAAYIKDASDGVQAFVGIVTAVLSSEYRAVLIDEPEAFLHPPLARKLGFQLANVITKRGGSLFASTHSPDFLIGCLQGSPSVRVVRLEYVNNKSKG